MKVFDSAPVRQPCILLRFNHFDPIWRRCWDRPFVEGGRRFASYREIETAWIDDAIASCADGQSCFMVEASWVLRHYLQLRPEQGVTLRRLAQEGRFEILGSGENIVDSNLIHGELLVRNLVLGTLWAQETLGKRPVVGWCSDGFGSSTQVPQIFRGCDYRWIPALSYNTPDAPYWRGLDGSAIFFESQGLLPHRNACRARIYQKYPPCPNCCGANCAQCFGRGFFAGERAEFTRPPEQPAEGAALLVLLLWGEEILPGLHVARDVAEFNRNQDRFMVRQGIYSDVMVHIQKELAAVDAPPAHQISSKVENNPSQSGCYVTRIKTKQMHRAAEHALLAAETLDTLCNAGTHADHLREAWRQMTLSGFHDAITATCVDPAAEELADLLAGVRQATAAASDAVLQAVLRPEDGMVTVFNTQSFTATAPVRTPLQAGWEGAQVEDGKGAAAKVYEVETEGRQQVMTFLATEVPALGCAMFKLSPAPARRRSVEARQVELDRFRLDIGPHGITRLEVEGLGSVVDSMHFVLGELVLETDIGDPWATRSLERTRWRLGPYAWLQQVQELGDSLVITYAGRHPSSDDPHRCEDPSVTWLEWTQAFRLRAGLPWIEINTHVQWHTHSRRLRLMFPSATRLNRGVFEVPYGVVERNRYEGQSNHGGNAGGDWPTLHWAGIQAATHTYAVFNAGTPSYRLEDGVVGISVLRSPQLPYGLYEPESYSTHNYFGMMDHGVHEFRHALCIMAGHWRDNGTLRQAAVFNSGMVSGGGVPAGPLPQWGLQASHAQITSVKMAEDKRGVILRIVETAGCAERVSLSVPQQFGAAYRTNLLEENTEVLGLVSGGASLDLRAWEIATVRVVPS